MENLNYQSDKKYRLDKFLAEQYPDISRSQIQKNIKNGLIRVNNEKVSAHHFLKNNDQIQVEVLKTKENIETGPKLKPVLVANEKDYLILNKPAGLTVHHTENSTGWTLADWLMENFPEVKGVGENEQRPGIVHRLDKKVSGLMVVAKNQIMYDWLKNQFQNRLVKKIYLGLCHGQLISDHGSINFTLERSQKTGKIVAKPAHESGKPSLTEYLVLKRFINYTYLELKLKSGRTHQIRVHLQALGHPLLGDKLYQNKNFKKKINLNRIFLHSHILGFRDLNEQDVEFQQALPAELQNILNNLN